MAEAATRVFLGGEPVEASSCPTLRITADSAEAPYFFEAMIEFSQDVIPHGEGYEVWRRERADAMAIGRAIRYCGTLE